MKKQAHANSFTRVLCRDIPGYYHAEDNSITLRRSFSRRTELEQVERTNEKKNIQSMPKALETAHSVLKEYSHILSVAHGGEVKNALQEMEKKWFPEQLTREIEF